MWLLKINSTKLHHGLQYKSSNVVSEYKTALKYKTFAKQVAFIFKSRQGDDNPEYSNVNVQFKLVYKGCCNVLRYSRLSALSINCDLRLCDTESSFSNKP